MDASEKYFLLEEYKSLKTEIFDLVAETRKIELAAAGAVAALFAWFVANPAVEDGAWFIPVIIPVLGGLRSFALLWRVQDIARYLRSLERAFVPETSEPAGWENHFDTVARSRLSPTAFVFWTLLLLITIAGPLIMES